MASMKAMVTPMVKRSTKKIFILDTNVILHDSSCIHQFEEHDIVIPITVLEELDNFKKGNDSIHYHAREFLRTLDSLSGDKLFNGGLPIGPGLGTIAVALEEGFLPELSKNFSAIKSDHRILNTATVLAQRLSPRDVILVSKDVNLRLKAKAVGLTAQDYTTDHVHNVSSLYRGYRMVEEVASDIIDNLYRPPLTIACDNIPGLGTLLPNEYVILRNEQKSALCRFNQSGGCLMRVEKGSAYGITPRNAEQTFALNALLDDSIKLITISGKAGTGKTLLALAAGLAIKKNYRQIFMARPLVPLSNREMGYLPGDINSKLDPYMKPLFDNLNVIQSQYSESDVHYQKISDLLESEKLQIAPLSFIRGRSLVKIYFIVDEAQNLTPHEVKTIITRAGEGTKIVLTGDIFQIDHPYIDSQSNGLSYLIEKMQGQPLYAHINLEKGERSELAELASNLL
jgi:PhoH-like ATPase